MASKLAFANVYTHRKVAEGAAKGCDICFKPTTSVLITPEKEDFFYICAKHLKERTFCTPVVDKAAQEAKMKKEEDEKKQAKEKALKEEMERVKKEYEEKKKKKDKKDDDKKDDKPGDKGDKDDKKDEKDKDEKKEETKESKDKDDEPRVFALQKFVYQQRVEKKRQAEMAKRNRERLSNPSFFPSVPKNAP